VYALPGSHPVKAGLLMLAHKRIGARRIDLPNMASRPLLRAMGFPGGTVPAVKLDGRRVQTTHALARALEELQPEPPLFPADPQRRASVEEAERWGDEVFQPVPRRIVYSGPVRAVRSDLASFFDGPLLGLPPRAAVAIAGPLLAIGSRVNGAADDAVRADLAALPGKLDHVDALIAEGTIGGVERNVADFQIAPTVRILMCFEDLRPAVAGRPAERLATEVVPDFPGHVRAVFPPEWLAPLR
jgi:glutathione S-transferase